MAESTQVISFTASMGVDVDQASLEKAKSEVVNGFKQVQVPIGANINKSSMDKVAKSIRSYIDKTGLTNFQFVYESKDLADAEKKLKNLKTTYNDLEKIKNDNLSKVSKRSYEDSDLATRAASKVNEVQKKTYKQDKYKDFYNESKTQYNKLHGNSKNGISLNDFKEYAMAGMLAQEDIGKAFEELHGLMSNSDWSKNDEMLKRAGELRNTITSRQKFIKELLTGQTDFAGTEGYKSLFQAQGIDLKNILSPIEEDVVKQVNKALTQAMTSTDRNIKKTTGVTNKLKNQFNKQWSDILAQEGILISGFDSSKPYKFQEGQAISPQQYNGAKAGSKNLMEKQSKGETLTDEELQKAEYYSKILSNYQPEEGSTTHAVDKNITQFLSEAVKKLELRQREVDRDFEMPADMKDMSNKDLISTFQSAREYIQKFNEKIKNEENIYAEEAKGLQEAVKTVDTYTSIKAEKGATIETPWSQESREWLSKNKDAIRELPSRNVTETKTNSVTEGEHLKESSVKVTADTSQLESALAKVDEKIASYEGKDIIVNLKANDSEFNTILQEINELRSKENIDITINFKANTENIDNILQQVNELRSKDAIDVAVNFKGNVEDLEKAITSTQKFKEDSNSGDTKIDINVNDEELTQAESKLTSLREKASEPIKVGINTDAVLDDLVTVEKIINDLKKNLDLKVKFNTGQSFTDKKASDIETMTNKIANLADKSTAYSAKIAGAFAGIGSSIREVTRLVDNLNKKFNLTGEIATGLKHMNKIFGGGTTTKSPNAKASNNEESILGLVNPESKKVKNAANRALSKTIVNQDLNQYTEDFAIKVRGVIEELDDLKNKHDGKILFNDEEIEKDTKRINELSASLTELGRQRNQFKLQNNQGTVIGEGLSLNDFNEAKAEELFRASGVNSNILETSMGRNGMAAYIKARSRDDGKLEKYAINFNQDTGIARSQLKSRSEYKSLFGQIVGDMGQEVTKLSKYLISMGGIDVVWQGFQQGIESIKEMDAAMTELKKVTSDTSDVYATVEKDMYATGKDIGRDAVELTKSTADWARLGYNTQDSEKMSKWTGILMNVSEFEQVDDATNALISIMQGFNKGADDVENVVDVLNNIGNLEPISSDEIASSLQRSASALQAAGANYEQSVALTTVGNSVVQNPESVGAGLKTVSLRIRGTDMNVLQEAGEDVDGYIQNTSQLRDLIKNQTKVASNDYKGFDLLKNDGSYKNPYEFLLGLGKIWSEIGSTDGGDLKQASILEKIAGKNRANIVASILQNPEMLEKVYNETQNSEGSALRENETQLDSIQGKVDQLTASFQEMWNTSISSDFIKGLVDAGTQITNLVTKAGLLRTAFMGALGVAGAKGKLGRANYQLSSCTMPRAI
jgi:TP901 family phage tail tape measure protein